MPKPISKRSFLFAALILLIGVYMLALPWLAARTDRQLNPVLSTGSTIVSEQAQRLHQSLRVADLHSDALLWRRDLLSRNDRGHSDVPRLLEGGFALQVFASVTKSPSGLNYTENVASSFDQITLLAAAQHWPLRTLNSLHQRALFHARRLESYADNSSTLRLIRTKSDLETALQQQELAAILATEGAHPLEANIANLDSLIAAGYRIVGLQHFFDNALGGSLHGIGKSGLSEFGHQVVRQLQSQSIVVDLAHSSEAVVRDVLAISTQPMIISHTGVKSICNTPRNIDDALLKAIANGGGLIGIGFWDGAVCDPTPAGIARSIIRAVDRFGLQAIALGSDFDGTVGTPFDASGIVALTQELSDQGMGDRQIKAVMGENAIQFFRKNLPE